MYLSRALVLHLLKKQETSSMHGETTENMYLPTYITRYRIVSAYIYIVQLVGLHINYSVSLSLPT